VSLPLQHHFWVAMEKAIWFIVALLFSSVNGDPDQANMIVDIIQSANRPSSVIGKLCWTPMQKNIQFSANPGLKNDYMQFHDEEQHIVILADLNCPDIEEYFEMNSTRIFFRAPFRWILFGDSRAINEDIVPEAIANVDVLIDSEVLVLRSIDDIYEMHFIYRISPNNTWNIEYYGSWDTKNRFQKSNRFLETTSLRRLDINEYEISICYVLTNNNSINHLSDGLDDHVDTITKVNFPTTNHLLDFLNAKRKYIFADTWGYKVNGTWNGMTGYLVRGEVEIGGSPMFFTFERVSIVDYISSPTPTRSKFVFQQPKLSYENNLFLLPFNTTVWYCTIALVFIIYLVLLLVTKWEWKKTKHSIETREKDAGVLRANVVDIIILIFGAACQQGSPSELKGSLGRIVMLVLFLALMFLYTSYSANIVALLQSSSSHIKTLDDLLHSRIKFGVHDTVFNRYYFSTATEPVRKAIYEKKVAPPGTTPRFMTMDEGVIQMRKGLFAFHMETGVGYKFVGKYFNEGEKCGLREIQYLQVIDPWLAVRKDTPFREMFKIGTKRIQEHGLQYRENRLMYEKRPKCSGGGSNFVSVSMVDCYPAILILSYGTIVALFFLGLEILVHKREKVLRKLKFVAKMCWDSNRYASVEAKLAKMLAKLNRPINIRYLRNNETIENDNYPNNNLLFVLNRTCEDANAFLRWASENLKFRKSYRWLILGKTLTINDSTRYVVSPDFNDIKISVDSEVIIIDEKENSNEVVLYTFYKLKPHTEWIIEDYGTWTPHTGFTKSKDRIESNVMRRKDFKGESLITSVAISDNRTKTDLLGLGNIFIDTPAKSSFRIIVLLFDFLNATKVVKFSETWGYFINGSWNGMIGDIYRGEADLCGMVTFITKERMTILEYLTHPTPITLKFVFRQPPLSYQNNLYLLPFSTGVWICTGAFIVILIAILYINTRWDIKKYEDYNKQKIDQSCLPPTWSDITIFVLSAISQQGSSNELKGTLGRLVMFLVFLAFVFLYTSYSANIVVLLQSTSNQIRTLSDLLHSRLELGLERASFNKFYFSSAYTADDPIKKALVETKIAPKGVLTNVMDIEQGVRTMQKKPFAFNMNTGTGYRIVSAIFQEHEKCGLQEIEYITNSNPWLCSRRLSPYGELFKVGYIRIQEHGLSDRENRLIYAKKPACTVMGGSFDSVNMVDFYPVCLILLYGMILAFLLLGVEIFVHRKQMKIRNQLRVE
ncbi:hypothetical protein HW555_000715, partial [Spodoptera exigua]